MNVNKVIAQPKWTKKVCPFCRRKLGRLERLKRRVGRICRCGKCGKIIDERFIFW